MDNALTVASALNGEYPLQYAQSTNATQAITEIVRGQESRWRVVRLALAYRATGGNGYTQCVLILQRGAINYVVAAPTFIVSANGYRSGCELKFPIILSPEDILCFQDQGGNNNTIIGCAAYIDVPHPINDIQFKKGRRG